MKRNRYLAVFLAAVLLIGCLSGCSAGKVATDSMAPVAPETALGDGFYLNRSEKTDSVTVQESGSSQGKGSGGVQNQKLIRTVNLEAETDDLDGLLATLDDQISALGGYVESRTVRNGSKYSNRSYRYANLTIRVPVAQVDGFAEHIRGASNVVSYQENAEDVTLSYVATQSRITALETEQARLLELLAQAQTMDDLLTIESRLTDVRTELEKVTSQLRLYDNLVDYGTIHLSITEVTEFTVVEEEETLWQRISSGFMESLRSLGNGITEVFVFLVVNLPHILVWGAVITAVVLWIKSRRKKKRAKAAQKPEQPQ